MADTKISALTAVVTPVAGDEFAVNQSGTSKKITLAQIGEALLFPDGTVSLPAIGFIDDTDNGIYRIGANNYGFSVGGRKLFELGGSQTALFQDTTPTTGDTKIIIREGAATSNNLFELQENNEDLGWIFSRPRTLTMGRDADHSFSHIGGAGTGRFLVNGLSAFTRTSAGEQVLISFEGDFTPTSGSAVFLCTQIAPIINQTGGANGITRGLFINPTLTAAADFRALEVALGKSIFQEIEVDGDLNHDGSNVGFYGTAPVAQPTSGADLTNNVTAGGTNDTIADYSDLSTYANDAAEIRNNFHQLARQLKRVNDGLRDLGLLT